MMGEFKVSGAGQDPAGRFVRHRGPSPARHRAGRRRVLDLLPCRGNRHHQGIHRRRAAVQRLHPAMAGDRRHGRAKRSREFYDDPVKTACDARCLAKAYHLRSLSIDNGLSWRAQRWARFIARLSQGVSRSIRERLAAGSIHGTWRNNPRIPATERSRQPNRFGAASARLIPEPGNQEDRTRVSGATVRPQSSSSSSSSSLSSSA